MWILPPNGWQEKSFPSFPVENQTEFTDHKKRFSSFYQKLLFVATSRAHIPNNLPRAPFFSTRAFPSDENQTITIRKSKKGTNPIFRSFSLKNNQNSIKTVRKFLFLKLKERMNEEKAVKRYFSRGERRRVKKISNPCWDVLLMVEATADGWWLFGRKRRLWHISTSAFLKEENRESRLVARMLSNLGPRFATGIIGGGGSASATAVLRFVSPQRPHTQQQQRRQQVRQLSPAT